MVIGLVFLFIGVIYLLKNLNIIQVPVMLGDIIIPILLIVAGTYLIIWSVKIRKLKDYKRKILDYENHNLS